MEASRWGKAALRIVTALVKARVKQALGEETLRAVAGELADLGHEELARRLEDALAAQSRREALTAALNQADACAQERLASTSLHGLARDLPLRDLPSLLDALEDLPADDLEETRLTAALEAVLQRDWRLPPEQARSVAGIYLVCLREALLGVETDALRTLGRAVLRTEEAVKRLEQALEEWRTRQARSIQIQGSVSQAVLIVGDHNVVQVFLRPVRVDHRVRVRRFLELYLGTPDRPVPFGGRTEDLSHLSRWLEEDARPYFFLHAPAGRGKSALLTRWAAALARHPDWAVVFVPVSLRANTHQPTVFLHLLAQGLAQAYEPDKTPSLDETNSEVLLSMAAEYLERQESPPGRRGLLVVLDGLDEAAWPHEPRWRLLFPLSPPSHLRVVVSARVLAVADAGTWVRRYLGWRPGLTHMHHLEHLSLEGVREVLAQMKVPLDQLSRDVDLVERLYHLTDRGDPLLVGLYAQDLLDTLETQGVEAARQRAYRIGQLVGSGYVTFVEDYWWPELVQWWEAQGLPGDTERRVREILDLLALAHGPIPEQDLLHLARRGPYPLDLDHHTLERVVWRNLSRVVLRYKEAGTFLVTFTHSRLREYFDERLRTRDPERRRELEERYRDWVKEAIARIAANPEPIREASPYVLQHGLKHLAQEPLETLLPIVTRPGWHRTRYAVEGTYEGFLEDVHTLWERATQTNKSALSTPEHPSTTDERRTTTDEFLPAIGLEIRCALIQSSIHSLAGNLPPELPALLVENGQWTPAQALAHVRLMLYDWQKAKALEALVPVLARKDPARLEEALIVARSIGDEDARVRALAALAPHLPEGLREQALAEALAAARSIRNEDARARALASLAPNLPERLLAEALAAARSIESEWRRAEVLAALAPHLPERLLAEALEAARSIRDEDDRVRALAALAPHLPPDLLAQALEAARSIRDEDARVRALEALAPHLPEGLREQALAEALAAARSLPEESLFGSPRAEALAALAPHLPEGLREQVLAEALAAARSIRDEDARVRALAALAPHLPEGLLAEALDAARSIWDEDDRTLAALAPHLPERLLAEALEAARSIEREDARVEALTALAPHLPPDLREQALSEALDAARSIKWEDDRARALSALAPRLAEMPTERLYPLWAETLPILARRTRRHLLSDLRALAPVIHALGGRKAVAETARAILDVGRWWP